MLQAQLRGDAYGVSLKVERLDDKPLETMQIAYIYYIARGAKGLIILAVLILIVGCSGSTGPQRPSQVKGKLVETFRQKSEESKEMALLELNMQLHKAADESLRSIVQEEMRAKSDAEGGLTYAMYEGGVWATIIERGDVERGAPKLGEECTARMRVMRLDGALYNDEELTAPVGKYEWPAAVDRNITEWNHGAKIRMYAPWYAAYGVAGKDPIPPYENVIIELDIE